MNRGQPLSRLLEVMGDRGRRWRDAMPGSPHARCGAPRGRASTGADPGARPTTRRRSPLPAEPPAPRRRPRDEAAAAADDTAVDDTAVEDTAVDGQAPETATDDTRPMTPPATLAVVDEPQPAEHSLLLTMASLSMRCLALPLLCGGCQPGRRGAPGLPRPGPARLPGLRHHRRRRTPPSKTASSSCASTSPAPEGQRSDETRRTLFPHTEVRPGTRRSTSESGTPGRRGTAPGGAEGPAAGRSSSTRCVPRSSSSGYTRPCRPRPSDEGHQHVGHLVVVSSSVQGLGRAWPRLHEVDHARRARSSWSRCCRAPQRRTPGPRISR